MARKRRDYHAEYARRKALGEERGLTLRQARVHPQGGEASVAALKRSGEIADGGAPHDGALRRYYRVVARLARGEPLRRALRAEGLSWRSATRLNEERVLYHYTYRTGKHGQPNVFNGFTVVHWARMPILTPDGVLHVGVPLDKKNASLVGTYWNLVEDAMRGKTGAVQRFHHLTIDDAVGNRYRLETNVNALYRFFDSLSDAEHADFDRTFYSGREVRHAAVS
jgi:hypothetical protein